VGDHNGTLILHEFSDSGLSTSNEAYARDHVAAGRHMVKRAVSVTTLDEIIARHAPPVMHFLKIDVEGMEKEVLAGLSLKRYRPWALVIEATRPNHPIDLSVAWESQVLGAGYHLVYRDGLNRFYLAEEQLLRASAFQVPPNVFDDFIPYRESAGNAYAISLEKRLGTSHERIDELGRDIAVVADTAFAQQRRLGELEIVLQQRQHDLEGKAREAERYRTDLLAVTETAQARQGRLDELKVALQQRQHDLEDKAREAERYRTDLLTVTETAQARQGRLDELEVVLQQRQHRLEDKAREAERYRTDLLVVTKTAQARQDRLDQLGKILKERQAELENWMCEAGALSSALVQRTTELKAAAEAAENRGVLIGTLEARISQSEQDLWGMRHAMHSALARNESLYRELSRILSSRSWRITAPLRFMVRAGYGAIARLLRTAAGISVLRLVGARLLTASARRKVMAIAGFTQQTIVAGEASYQAPSEADPDAFPVPPISRAATRLYRILASSSPGRVNDE
jgi:hypothetical protein